jgi:hypothetical protein
MFQKIRKEHRKSAAGTQIRRAAFHVTVTRGEIERLMAGLLYAASSAAGKTKLTGWVLEHELPKKLYRGSPHFQSPL